MVMRRFWINVSFILLCCVSLEATAQETDDVYDVVIYGGTSAAITAAVQTKQMGKSVVIVSPDKHLGGLTSGGLGWTDSGKKDAVGGLSREFYHRVWKHYQADTAWRWQPKQSFANREQSVSNGTVTAKDDRPTMWVFEPHVAEKIFDDWVAQQDIPVHRDRWLDRSSGGVTIRDGRIESFRTLDGQVYRGKMFIDATYEGDLMARPASITTSAASPIRRTANNTTASKPACCTMRTTSSWKGIRSVRRPGDPTSGLLPRISADPTGRVRGGDHRDAGVLLSDVFDQRRREPRSVFQAGWLRRGPVRTAGREFTTPVGEPTFQV
jgi:hypothetical protein